MQSTVRRGSIIGWLLAVVMAALFVGGNANSATGSVADTASQQEALELSQKGVELYQKGQYREAEDHFRRALAVREKALGPDHPSVATSINNLALLYQTQGQYAQADPLYQRALTIREKALTTRRLFDQNG